MLQFLPMLQSSKALWVAGAFWLAGVSLTGGWALGAEPQQTEAGPPGVVNYTRVDATVACAGATPPSAMVDLKARGFVSVINFRTAGEPGANIPEGQAAAESAGLKYFHLPFSRATPEVTEAFLDAVANPANQPVLIHCGIGESCRRDVADQAGEGRRMVDRGRDDRSQGHRASLGGPQGVRA